MFQTEFVVLKLAVYSYDYLDISPFPSMDLALPGAVGEVRSTVLEARLHRGVPVQR